MGEQNNEGSTEDEPEREDPDKAADASAQERDASQPLPEPKIDLTPVLRAVDVSQLLPKIDLTPVLRAVDVSQLLPKIDLTPVLRAVDVSQLLPEIDLTPVLRAVDVSQLLPEIDLTPVLRAVDVSQLLPEIDLTPVLRAVDVSQLLPKIDFSSLMPDFQALLEDLRRHEPPNWPPNINLDRVIEVIRDDGLPLVWVPRSELVQDVLDADDRETRVTLLLAHVPELLEDCRGVLRDVTHVVLTGPQNLAGRCVEALEQGHHEAAQALAVAVTETAVSRTLGGNYAKVKQQVLFDPDLVPYTQLRLRAALAPIHRFYTDWSPKSPHPAPEAVSRHVTVHRADPSHYTAANSLVAVLLACSVLRALQELQQLVEASGPDQATA